MRLDSQTVGHVADLRANHGSFTRDGEIADEVLNALFWDYAVPRDRLTVRVDNGWVTLTGDVDWDYQRDCAGADALRTDGVIGVTNRIALAPARAGHRRSPV